MSEHNKSMQKSVTVINSVLEMINAHGNKEELQHVRKTEAESNTINASKPIDYD